MAALRGAKGALEWKQEKALCTHNTMCSTSLITLKQDFTLHPQLVLLQSYGTGI